MPRPNIYPDNPHPPGTLLAGSWDLNRAMKEVGKAAKKAALEDARRMREFTRRVTERSS